MPRKPANSEKGPADKDPAAGTDDLSFEDSIGELEAIVERMEQGELSLQDSLHAYQRGAALVGRCRTALDSVNQQVKVLEGDLLKPLNPDDVAGDLLD